ARLVDIAKLHRVADPDYAAVGRLLLSDHPKKRSLARAVRSDHADDAARRQFEAEIVDQQPVGIALFEMFEVDDIGTEPLGDRDDYLGHVRPFVRLFGNEIVITLDARLVFGLAGYRRGGDPFSLAFEGALARLFLAAFLKKTLLLLHQPGG